MSVLFIVLVVIAALLVYQILLRIARRVHPFPAPAFIGWLLDSDFRRFFQPPGKLIERSGIKPGMTALDVGCGSGAFTTFVARAIGVQGRLYALDIQTEMLKQLEHKLVRAENRDIQNIVLVNASAYDMPFDNDSLDVVYMVTVLPEIPDRGRALREIKRVLKPGGILAVSELLADPDYPLSASTIKICRREGFIMDASIGNLWNYTVRFNKPLREAPVAGES